MSGDEEEEFLGSADDLRKARNRAATRRFRHATKLRESGSASRLAVLGEQQGKLRREVHELRQEIARLKAQIAVPGGGLCGAEEE